MNTKFLKFVIIGSFLLGIVYWMYPTTNTTELETITPLPQNVHFNTIYECGLLAYDIYQADSLIRTKYADQLLELVALPTFGGRYGVFLDSVEKQITIVIRGTAIPENGFHDIVRSVYLDTKIFLEKNVPLDACMHVGFQSEAMVIYEQLQPLLSSYTQKGYKIVVIGHSLGGAVAAIVTALFHHNGLPIQQCITFGQPKFTDANSSSVFDTLPILRIVNYGDIVPMLPPLALESDCEAGYQHVGQEIVLLDSIYFSYLPERLAENPVISSLWENLGNEHVDQHFLLVYLRRLEAKIKTFENVPFEEEGFYESMVNE